MEPFSIALSKVSLFKAEIPLVLEQEVIQFGASHLRYVYNFNDDEKLCYSHFK